MELTMSNLKKEPHIPCLKNMSGHLTASKPWNQNQSSVGMGEDEAAQDLLAEAEAAQDLVAEAEAGAELLEGNLKQNLLQWKAILLSENLLEKAKNLVNLTSSNHLTENLQL
jgi:hypothetical protein